MHSSLARHFAIAYILLLAYACLHPLAGWRDNGLPVFSYLTAPWPKYFRVEELALNVFGYIPLGFILVPALHRPAETGRTRAMLVLVITTLAFALSLTLETIQQFIPSRISSNVDLGCNTLGAFLGALCGLLAGHRLFSGGILERWRNSCIVPGRTGDAGLILLGLWLLAQLQPLDIPFESGDLRTLLSFPALTHFEPARFIRFEALLVGTGMLSIGLFTHSLLRTAKTWPVVLILLAGMAAKTLASSLFLPSGTLGDAYSPGTRYGLLLGVFLILAARHLPRPHQLRWQA